MNPSGHQTDLALLINSSLGDGFSGVALRKSKYFEKPAQELHCELARSIFLNVIVIYELLLSMSNRGGALSNAGERTYCVYIQEDWTEI